MQSFSDSGGGGGGGGPVRALLSILLQEKQREVNTSSDLGPNDKHLHKRTKTILKIHPGGEQMIKKETASDVNSESAV